MLDLYEELKRLVGALDAEGAEYALCGGLAMAVHGHVRATVDIDLLVVPESIERAKEICRTLGFVFEARTMLFAEGAVRIERMTASGQSGELSIDLIVVDEATRGAWETRTVVAWEDLRVPVVSRRGLIALKRLRASAQDIADIERLEASDAH